MDVLKWMLPSEGFMRDNHLAMPNNGQPTYTKVVGNQIWYMKNIQGYPWDMNTFDDLFVYQSITEVSWTDPKTFKIFSSKSWLSANGGIVWSPRDVSEVVIDRGIVTVDSSYRKYTDCTNFTVHDLGAPILTDYSFDEIDFGGDLKTQRALVLHYRWGQNYANLEVDSYVEGYGWVQWELWQMQDGRYVQKQVSNFNTIKSGGAPNPVFPCGVPIIK